MIMLVDYVTEMGVVRVMLMVVSVRVEGMAAVAVNAVIVYVVKTNDAIDNYFYYL